MANHLHPEHKLPVRTRIMTITRQQHDQNSNSKSNSRITEKQQQIQREIAAQVSMFQEKLKNVQLGIKEAKLRAEAAKDINRLRSKPEINKERGEMNE